MSKYINLSIHRTIIIGLMILGFATKSHAVTYNVYIDADAPSGGNGLSWASAYNNLDAALNYIVYGTTVYVWIAEGTYEPSGSVGYSSAGNRFYYGGFAGNETSLSQRDGKTHPTVIKNSKLRLGGTNNRIDSLILNNTKIDIANNSRSNVIQDCLIYGIDAVREPSGPSYSPIYPNAGSQATITGCTIFDNTHEYDGGAIRAIGNNIDIAIRNSIFCNNASDKSGGAIYASASVSNTSSLDIANTLFLNNYAATEGGVIYDDQIDLITIANSNFIANDQAGSATLYLYTPYADDYLYNNIFQDGSQTAIYHFGLNKPETVRNNLFYGYGAGLIWTNADIELGPVSLFTDVATLNTIDSYSDNVVGPAIYATEFTSTFTGNPTLDDGHSIIDDISQNFVPGSLQGKVIQTGAGDQYFVIVDNTSDTLKVYGDLGSAGAGNDSNYSILAFNHQSISPVINAGITNGLSLPSTDIDGDTRVDSVTVDIGIQESDLPPWVLSVTRMDPNPTHAQSVRFEVEFTDPVTGFDISDLQLVETGSQNGAIQSITGSENLYTVTVLTGDTAGTLSLQVLDDNSIIDPSSNPLSGGIGIADGFFDQAETYSLLNEPELLILYNDTELTSGVGTYQFADGSTQDPPATLSFEIRNEGRAPLDTISINAPVPFSITDAFDDPLAVGTTDSMTLSLTNGSPGNFADTVILVTNDSDESAFPISVTGKVFHNFITPQVASITAATEPILSNSASFTITFNDDVVGVDTGDFQLIKTGQITSAVINSVSGSGNTYFLNVTFGAGWGDIEVRLYDNDSIEDLDGTKLGGTGTNNGTFSEIYEVDLPGNNLFVNINAAPGGDGLSWATAFDTIQEGVTAAYSANKDTVWIAAGTYHENIDSRYESQLRGGFAGTETLAGQRLGMLDNRTIIVAQDISQPTLDLSLDNRVALEKLWITGSQNSGIYSNNSGAVKVIDCVIYGNDGGYGGGIYMEENDFLIDGCWIFGNSASNSGGGIGTYITNAGDITILNSIISGNLNNGVYITGSSSNVTILNCDISGNSSLGIGGGAVIASPNAWVENCTFIGNTASTKGGLYLGSSTNLTVINSIFKSNTKQAIYENTSTSNVTLINNLFHANPNGDVRDYTLGILTGATEINALPEASDNFDGDPLVRVGIKGTWSDVPIGGLFNTLTDDGARYEPHSLIGKRLKSYAAPSPLDEQLFMIVDNTTTTIELYGAIGTFMFDEGTEYEIVDYELQDNSPAFNAGLATYTLSNSLDVLGNPRISLGGLDLGAYEQQSIDNPVVVSISRVLPTTSTNLALLPFKVLFSESVTGFDVLDLVVDETGVSGSSIASISGSGRTYIVVVETGSGSGTISLDFIDDDSVVDSGGVPIEGLGSGNGDFTDGETYIFTDEPEIQLTFEGAVLADGIDTLNFETHLVNATHPTRTLVVKNLGSSSLSISGVAVPTGYSIVDGLGANLPSMSTDSLTIALDTSLAGYFSGNLIIDNNDSDENNFSLAFIGQVNEPQTMPSLVPISNYSSDHAIIGRDINDAFSDSYVMDHGDFNGDGFNDFVFATKNGQGVSNSAFATGEAYLILGQADMPNITDLRNVWGPDMDMVVYGNNGGEYIAASMLALEDVNGDGLDDMILGTSYGRALDSTSTNRGRIYIIFGRKDNIPSSVRLDLGQADVLIGTSSYLIDSVTYNHAYAFGDINHDGITDIIVGSESGRGYVFFGRNTWPSQLDFDSGGANIILTGLNDGKLGINRGIRTADINGDNIEDVVMADLAGNLRRGNIYVIFGRTIGFPSTISLESEADVVIRGEAASYDFSDSAYDQIALTDVNGDGIQDILLAATWADGYLDAAATCGEVYILPGRTSWPAIINLVSDPADGHIIGNNDGVDTKLGEGGIYTGDFNGDGFGDFIVYTPDADGENLDLGSSGEGYLFLGSPSIPFRREVDKGEYDMKIRGSRVGHFLSRDGLQDFADVNADGLDDLIFGTGVGYGPNNNITIAGDAFVVFGTQAPNKKLHLLEKKGDVMIYGGTQDYLSARFVRGLDYNQDGINDVIVSAINADGLSNSRSNAGEVHVVHGSGPAKSATVKRYTLPGDALPQEYGSTHVSIDYTTGSSLSLTEVTWHRDRSLISHSPIAGNFWEIQTDRSDFEAVVTIQYTDHMTSGIVELNNMQLLKADSPAGPFTPITADIDVQSNTIVTTVTSFSWFVLTAENPDMSVYDGITEIVDDQDTIDFGAYTYGDTITSRTFTVTNTGIGDLHLSTPTLTGGYELTEPLDLVIAPGGDDSFTITLPSPMIGLNPGSISIVNDDPASRNFTIALSADVGQASLEVRNGSYIPDGGGPVDFGSNIKDSYASTVTFTVLNKTTYTASIDEVTVSAPWHVTEPLADSIPSLGSDMITIEMATGSSGTFAGTLSVISNALPGSYDIQLSGDVYVPASSNIIYVKFDWTGFEDGTMSNPFNDLLSGSLYVNPSGTIRIESGSSAESVRITKPMTLEAINGTVRIGDNQALRTDGAQVKNQSRRTSADLNWLLYE